MDAILTSLLSTDNDTRNQAEQQFSALALTVKLPHLVKTISTVGTSDEVKTMACVLLRRVFLQLEYNELSAGVEDGILRPCKAQLLQALSSEPVATIRRKIGDAVAELARSSIDDDNVNHWMELLSFLFECCTLDHPQRYESALHIISVVPGVFANQLAACIDVVKGMLLKALQAPHKELLSEAFKAATSFITHLDSAQLRGRFVDMIPLLLAILGRSVEEQEDDSLLKAFIDLGDQCPKFLRPHLESVIQLMLKIMALTELDDSWRQLALEMIVTTAENAPAMMRKQARFLPNIVSQSLQFMLEVGDDDSEWLNADSLEDEEDSTSNAVAGETSLDRLANALGGKVILPDIINNIPAMLQNNDWRYRHAMLMAISAIGEGCEKQVQPILGEVVAAVLPYCQDQHPRVRYAACNALGQLANDFAPTLQTKYHDKVISALLIALDDYPTPRVQTHAGAALVNFFEQCTQSVLSQYLGTVAPKLQRVLQVRLDQLHTTGKKLVLEQIVTTIATLADSVESSFIPFYDHFMPSLKYIMKNATDKQFRLLRGKTIECISLMGLAVGQEKFMPDAQEVMEVLVKAQDSQGEMEPDDPQVSYFISAWARMCKIIGPAFVEYLPIVMGPLMQAASIKPEIAIIDSDTSNLSEDDGWEFVTLADQQKFGIKTAGLDEKCTAMQMLVVYAKDLKDGFADFAEPVARIMVPHLRFYFHELVRGAAAEILPHLLECVKVKGPEAVRQIWGYMADKLLEAINLEPEPEIVGIMMDSLCKCIELLGANCFTPEQYSKLVELLKDAMEMTFSRASERLKKREDEDYDEQVEEEIEEEVETDDQYLMKVSDVIHSLFGTHGANILPLFDALLPTFASMLAEDRPSNHKQLALCVFDDVLEFASSSALKYQEYFLQPMLKCICDKSPPVRQAASYGFGIMAQHCSKDFSQSCLEALPLLSVAIQNPKAREDFAAVNATENAISAVTKICKYIESGVPLDTMLPLWFSWLPVVEDKEEAPHVYSYLCDLIESNNPHILGQDNSNVPRILFIIATACEANALEEDEQVLLRLLSIARHIQASKEIWDMCMQSLSHEQRTALESAIA